VGDPNFATLQKELRSSNGLEAWETFLGIYSSILYQTAVAYSDDEDEAADCYLYICEQLSRNSFRRLLKFKPEGSASLTTWLRVVSRNLCYDWHRAHGAGGAKIEKDAMDSVASGCGGSSVCADHWAVGPWSAGGEPTDSFLSDCTGADGYRQVRTGTGAPPAEWRSGEKSHGFEPFAGAHLPSEEQRTDAAAVGIQVESNSAIALLRDPCGHCGR